MENNTTPTQAEIDKKAFEIDKTIQMDIVSSYLGRPLTKEQSEFAKDFTKNTISFSDPGTGKTYTLVAGLIMLQKFYRLPGKLINCMSFTVAAKNEIAGRYTKVAEKSSIPPTVVFNTFHALTRQILMRAYPTMKTGDSDTKQDVEVMTEYLKQVGCPVEEGEKQYVRKVIRAIRDLNSALIFHPENVLNKFQFHELNMDLDVFQELRTLWFQKGITSGYIGQGEIPLYALWALMRNPLIVKEWRGKYKVMIVDEFQDLSLLDMHILSYVAETLIVVGDMKQQIYAFNGACPEIVSEYMKLYPDARVCNLTKSFRCGSNIAEFATKVIRPNYPDIECFTGHDRGSSVTLLPRRELDWAKIASGIETEIKTEGAQKTGDTMFLYRNNASAIPIIEELYRHNIPFRCTWYKTIMNLPMFESLSKLVNAAWQPDNPEMCNDALRLFPEFKYAMYGSDCYPVQAIRSSGKNLFDINYKYKEQSSYDLLNAMIAARQAIADNKSAGVVYMKVMTAYKKHIFKSEWWKLDNTEEFYFNLVAPICNSKTYPLMYNEELDKSIKNEHAQKAGLGVRCYTMHTAKGLEADKVYILDCDEGSFPNANIMKRKLDAGCELDVATDIRSERNLLYVAITRAKNDVIISYSGAEPTRLITNPNASEYTRYDKVYADAKHDYDDAGEFFRLFNLEEVR